LAEKARNVITVFGSSRSKSGDADYQEAHELGGLLARAGFTICSGGYSGSMEAVSRGAREAGGQTIGVTVDVIRRSGNEWLDEEMREETIFRRIEKMTTLASGFVALRGGAGTLAEVALTLNLLFLGALEPRPLVLVGKDWQAVMNCIFQHLVASEPERQLLSYADSPTDAARQLTAALA
jgi:uncharacterized protein (TIGR00730 family)